MRDADFAWLTDHSAERFRRYAGKWIAVRNGEIIGVGDMATEAAQQARQRAEDTDFILEALDADAEVILGRVQTA